MQTTATVTNNLKGALAVVLTVLGRSRRLMWSQDMSRQERRRSAPKHLSWLLARSGARIDLIAIERGWTAEAEATSP